RVLPRGGDDHAVRRIAMGERRVVRPYPRDRASQRLDGDPRAGRPRRGSPSRRWRSEEHTSELQSRVDLVCRLLLEKKKKTTQTEEKLRHTDRMRARDQKAAKTTPEMEDHNATPRHGVDGLNE